MGGQAVIRLHYTRQDLESRSLLNSCHGCSQVTEDQAEAGQEGETEQACAAVGEDENRKHHPLQCQEAALATHQAQLLDAALATDQALHQGGGLTSYLRGGLAS